MTRENWGSRFGFIMATAGFAVGKIRSSDRETDVKITVNAKKITLSLTRFFINLR